MVNYLQILNVMILPSLDGTQRDQTFDKFKQITVSAMNSCCIFFKGDFFAFSQKKFKSLLILIERVICSKF